MFEAEIVELYGNRMYKAVLKRKRERAEQQLNTRKDSLVNADEELAKKQALSSAADLKAHADAADDDDQDHGAVGGRPRAAPGGAQPSRNPGGLASTMPTVTKLIIAGDGCASSLLRAQGYLESCRCVRFQWYSSRGGRSFEPIPFAMMPTFFATADDVGSLIAVNATPVTDDGFEGIPRRAKVGPMRLRTDTSSRVTAILETSHSEHGCWVQAGLRGFSAMTHVDELSGLTLAARLHITGLSVSMELSAEAAEVAGPIEWRPAGSFSIRGILCQLDRAEDGLLHIVAPFGGASAPQLQLLFAAPTDRDIVALVLRELAKGGAAALAEPDEELAPTDDE